MKEQDQSRLASILMLMVGIWVAISPIWLSVGGAGAMTSVIATGAGIGVFAIIQYFWRNTFPSWIMGLAAIWLFISMFVFGGIAGGAVLSGILSAIAVFLMSLWDGTEVSELNSRTSHNVTA